MLATAGSIALLVSPGVIGWILGDLFWISGLEGAFAACALLILLGAIASSERMMDLAFDTLSTVVLLVPIIYCLTLIGQTLLVMFSLTTYSSSDFFFKSALGTLAGAGTAAVANFFGTVRKAAQDTSGSQSGPGRRQSLYRAGLIFWIPIGFLIAVLWAAPPGRTVHVAIGALWGCVAAATAVILALIAEPAEPARRNRFNVLAFEGILLFCLIAALVTAPVEPTMLTWGLEFIPAAMISCIVAYLAGAEITWLARAIARKQPHVSKAETQDT